MINVDSIFDELFENSINSSKDIFVSKAFDNIIEEMHDIKNEIVEKVLKDIKILYEMKDSSMNFKDFQYWVEKRMRKYISDEINENEYK